MIDPTTKLPAKTVDTCHFAKDGKTRFRSVGWLATVAAGELQSRVPNGVEAKGPQENIVGGLAAPVAKLETNFAASFASEAGKPVTQIAQILGIYVKLLSSGDGAIEGVKYNMPRRIIVG